MAFLQRATAGYAERGIKVRRVMSDNGSNYLSRVFAAAWQASPPAKRVFRPSTPRTNGKAERLIQMLLREWAYLQPYQHSRLRKAALLSALLQRTPTARQPEVTAACHRIARAA